MVPSAATTAERTFAPRLRRQFRVAVLAPVAVVMLTLVEHRWKAGHGEPAWYPLSLPQSTDGSSAKPGAGDARVVKATVASNPRALFVPMYTPVLDGKPRP